MRFAEWGSLSILDVDRHSCRSGPRAKSRGIPEWGVGVFLESLQIWLGLQRVQAKQNGVKNWGLKGLMVCRTPNGMPDKR